MLKNKTCIIWFRKDLRLSDHAGLRDAVAKGYHILPLYILDNEGNNWSEGSASLWWLHHALSDLDQQLQEYGARLHILKSGQSVQDTLTKVIQDFAVDVIYWGRRYEPLIIERDKLIKKSLRESGYEVRSFNTHLIFEPHTIQNKAGSYFKVFTPYWNHCRNLEIEKLDSVDLSSSHFIRLPSDSLTVDDLKLLPKIPWDKGFYDEWNPTRAGAIEKLELMTQSSRKKSIAYQNKRDIPAEDGTSKLAPWLQWGQISSREIYHTLAEPHDEVIHSGYLRQLFWREFSYHLLFHAPHSSNNSLKHEYDLFPWSSNDKFLAAWKSGQTGFPIVDAGMRQLWQTGWMHNRVRMIVSSFLVKHLLQDWREGAHWFWDTLVDADLANNTMGWQWIAGSGADASPYFRIFNPITQGEKFDKTGEYVRKFCPELRELPDKYLHQPWELEPLELATHGVTLGKNYPHPIISHSEGRSRALDAFAKFKELKNI